MNTVIIKKTSESLAETKKHDFVDKISHVWEYEGWGEKEVELVTVTSALGLIQVKSSEAFL